MNSNNELTKRQHYVQRKYLEAWTNHRGLLFQLFKPSRIVELKPDNAQVSNFFYKFNSINEVEKKFLLSFIPEEATGHFISRKQCNSIEDVLTVMKELPSAISKSNNYFLYSIDLLLWVATVLEFIETWPDEVKNNDDYKSIVRFIETQSIEKLLCGIEELGVPVIEKINDSNLNLASVSEEEKENLIRYIVMSYVRSKDMADRVVQKKNPMIRIERIRSLLQYILGIDLGQTLIHRNSNVIVYKNTSSLSFITGSQPVVNMCYDGKSEAKGFLLFCPLNPTTGVLIGSKEDGSIEIDFNLRSEDVSMFNNKINELSSVLISPNRDNLLQFVSET